ncbi:MAG: methionine biosynthesis protein MetW [Dehalococcoidia bacterium]|nr:methionine biosynthesis protein MetW [Dehalococcoidia bacterium]
MIQATATKDKAREEGWRIAWTILAHLGPASRVLDVGCGGGRLISFLARETTEESDGQERSPRN